MKNWTDVYKLPLHIDKYGGYIWDENENMVAQFTSYQNKVDYSYIIDILNGDKDDNLDFIFNPVKQTFSHNGNPFLLIRGWGGLTGRGGLNLSQEEAVNIQDGFAEFILTKLTIQL